jgi:hypothetical protein
MGSHHGGGMLSKKHKITILLSLVSTRHSPIRRVLRAPPREKGSEVRLIGDGNPRPIDDLFLFSKLDMQKLDFQFEDAQVRLFIRDMMEEFKFELEERKVEFLYNDRMEEDCSFYVDRKRLHQVFRNIIGNAVKYARSRTLKSIADCIHRMDLFVLISGTTAPGSRKRSCLIFSTGSTVLTPSEQRTL